MGKKIKRLLLAPVAALAVFALGACVTINVYFPAAEAQAAAEEFVEKVLDEGANGSAAEGEPQAHMPARQQRPGGIAASRSSRARSSAATRASQPLGLRSDSDTAVHSATMPSTPAIQAIQDRMAARFQSGLRPHFDSGALGFGNDGLLVLRDASKVPLKDRVSVNQLVAEDNRDRNAVYREIAVANNHPEWEDQIRQTFSRQWVASARAGWWYQAADGSWKQK